MHKDPIEAFNRSSNDMLHQLMSLVSKKMGLSFSDHRRNDFYRNLLKLAKDQGYHHVDPYMEDLLSSQLGQRELELLASSLTIGETYFFRDVKSLKVSLDEIIPQQLNSSSKSLRIWSAGCSSGEEPYTVSILLHQRIPQIKDWNIKILATDIHQQALEKARTGQYGRWSFRSTPDAVRDLYFRPLSKGLFQIKGDYKQLVDFSYLNLAQDDYPSIKNSTQNLQLILCRNVMIYFNPQTVEHMIDKFYHCLVEGGWLIVAPSEIPLLLSSPFSKVIHKGVTLFQKIKKRDDPFKTILPSLPVILDDTPKELLPKERSRDYCKEALALYELGEYNKVKDLLGEYFSKGGEEDPLSITLMARTLANQGQLKEALLWCKRALALDKTDSNLHYLMGMIYQEEGQPFKALEAFKGALYLDPTFIAAHYSLAMIALFEERLMDMERHLKNTVNLLSPLPKESKIPQLDGMTAGRLLESIETLYREEGIDDR